MILVDGKPCETVSARDRGLHYGDGLFETLAVVGGRPQLWEPHMRRLAEGCRRLGLPPPASDLLRGEADRLCAERERGVLKILLTRGQGGRGYRPPRETETVVTRVLSWHPPPDYPPSYYREGVALRLCRTRLGHNPALAGIKHLNRLEQVLARAEWREAAIAEGLMLDQAGHPIEGTQSNLFLVRRGVLATPDLSCCGVAGVMRDLLIELARGDGHEVEVARLGIGDLQTADEVFLCNSLIGVWPVRRCGDWDYRPGPVATRLAEAVRGVCLMPDL